MTINVIRTLGPLQVETKVNWDDEWTVRPNIEPINASAAVGGIGQFQFRVRYGQLKHPSQSTFGTGAYTLIQRDWIRVKRAPYGDGDILFMGRVESDLRNPTGPQASAPSGVQMFTAYDGTQILNKTEIGHSIIHTGASNWQRYDILIPFNLHPNGRSFIQNSSIALRTSGGIEHRTFAATGTYWSIADAIRYLIAEFVGGSGNPAVDPLWQVTIPSGQLTNVLEPMAVPRSATLFDLLNQIVGRQFGWVWVVVPTTNGFNLKLSTVTASAVTFEGVSVPANPNVSTVSTSDPNLQMTIERTQVQQFGKIRVQGKPMVVATSFEHIVGNDAGSSMEWDELQDDSGNLLSADFVGKLTPSFWTADILPTVQEDGTLDLTTMGPLPTLSAGTMTAIPVKAGHDYNLDGVPSPLLERDFQPPMLIYEYEDSLAFKYEFFTNTNSASLYTLPTDIGIQIRDYPNRPVVRKWYITVAFEAAQRIQCVYEVPGGSASDGEKVIDVPDAELWYLAKDMIYGIVPGETQLDRLDNGLEIRNDRERLYRVMAGAIARYVNARAKARMTFKGLFPYQENLGHIFGAASDATDIATIAAPITSVQWQFEGDFSTTVATGFSI